MTKINKKRLGLGWVVLIISLAFVSFGLLIRYLLHGNNVAILNPRGHIAQEQLELIIYAFGLLLAIGIPSIFLLYFIAWKYRESNTKATYDPHVRHGKGFNFTIWAIPGVFVVLLAFVMLPATQKLEPQKSIDPHTKPLKIQVVSLRWKWLFIYPEQQIATVNFMQLPVNTPVEFELTADEAPMSSFWIPNLGGQLYTMTGHVNRLNLLADTAGDYPGSSAEINGAGFAGMKFIARASSAQDFDSWVQQVKQAPETLDAAKYQAILQPSENNPAAFYSSYDSDLYDNVVMKYHTPSEGHEDTNHEAVHH